MPGYWLNKAMMGLELDSIEFFFLYPINDPNFIPCVDFVMSTDQSF